VAAGGVVGVVGKVRRRVGCRPVGGGKEVL